MSYLEKLENKIEEISYERDLVEVKLEASKDNLKLMEKYIVEELPESDEAVLDGFESMKRYLLDHFSSYESEMEDYNKKIEGLNIAKDLYNESDDEDDDIDDGMDLAQNQN